MSYNNTSELYNIEIYKNSSIFMRYGKMYKYFFEKYIKDEIDDETILNLVCDMMDYYDSINYYLIKSEGDIEGSKNYLWLIHIKVRDTRYFYPVLINGVRGDSKFSEDVKSLENDNILYKTRVNTLVKRLCNVYSKSQFYGLIVNDFVGRQKIRNSSVDLTEYE